MNTTKIYVVQARLKGQPENQSSSIWTFTTREKALAHVRRLERSDNILVDWTPSTPE